MLDHARLVREVLAAAGLRVPHSVERMTEGVGNHLYLAGDVVVRLGTGSDAPRFSSVGGRDAGRADERLARNVLDAAGVHQPEQIDRAPEGVGNHVYLAGEVVVRLGTGSDAAMFPRAIAVLRAARGQVKVPEVIFADCTRERFSVPVMVLARVRGEPLSWIWPTLPAAARWRMVEGVAAELAALHALRPEEVPDAGFASPWWRARVERIEVLMARLRPTAAIPTADLRPVPECGRKRHHFSGNDDVFSR